MSKPEFRTGHCGGMGEHKPHVWYSGRQKIRCNGTRAPHGEDMEWWK